jgi:hypothetical protein
MWKVSERKNRNRNMKVNQELKLGKKTRVKTKAMPIDSNLTSLRSICSTGKCGCQENSHTTPTALAGA